MKHLTVVICTHNRNVLLENTLISLNRAARPEGYFVNIFVVANACTDDTSGFLNNYQALAAERSWLPLAWIADPVPGKSHALNCAISHLKAELVTYVDDDHRVDENYLTGICAASEAYPEATLFCGRILPDWDGSEPAWAHDTGRYRIYPLPVPLQDQGDVPHPIDHRGFIPGGGNIFLRRKLFERVGGFSQTLGPQGHNLGGGEDTDFVLRALSAGEQMVYIPNVKQYHYVDSDRFRLGFLLRKSFQRSRATVNTRHVHTKVPLYMWRKLAEYSFHVLYSLSWSKTRFYLVRVAAVLGEISGTRKRTPD